MSSEDIAQMTSHDLLDGREYYILQDAAKAVKNVPGISCEIGVRRGGSSFLIMQAFAANADRRLHIGIDPYGNLPYYDSEGLLVRYNYTADMRRAAAKMLHAWCEENQYDFQLFVLEDTEFFARYKNGVPVYNLEKSICNQYAYVYFDGPHCVECVKPEIDFFLSRTPVGGVWIFDDIDHYPHVEQFDKYILNHGFCHLQVGKAKIAYQRLHLN